MVKRYKKRPVEISAIEFTRHNIKEVLSFVGNSIRDININTKGNITATIDTLEGAYIATEGDYIIKGVKGEFYPCKPDVFKMTYILV